MRSSLLLILPICVVTAVTAISHAAQAGGPLVIRMGASDSDARSAKPLRLPPRLTAAMKRFGFRFLQEGQPAMDFTLKDLDGTDYHLSNTHGTWVLLNFFATWCGPCMREMPALEALSRAGRCLEVVGVATGKSEQPHAVAQQGVDFPLLWDSEGAVGNVWGVHSFPTTYLIDPHGFVQAMAVGVHSWEQMSGVVPTLPGCARR